MAEQARVVVVMGVSGVGKTTVGRALARELGYTFVDADDFHASESVEKMRRGEALTDEDRAPWLASLRARLDRGDRVVLACSALKRRYRDALGPATFVLLDAPDEVIHERLSKRSEHYAGPALLASQRRALEPVAITIDATRSVPEIIADIRSSLR